MSSNIRFNPYVTTPYQVVGLGKRHLSRGLREGGTRRYHFVSETLEEVIEMSEYWSDRSESTPVLPSPHGVVVFDGGFKMSGQPGRLVAYTWETRGDHVTLRGVYRLPGNREETRSEQSAWLQGASIDEVEFSLREDARLFYGALLAVARHRVEFISDQQEQSKTTTVPSRFTAQRQRVSRSTIVRTIKPSTHKWLRRGEGRDGACTEYSWVMKHPRRCPSGALTTVRGHYRRSRFGDSPQRVNRVQ